MDGLDAADRDLLRDAGVDIGRDDLACVGLSRGRAHRRAALVLSAVIHLLWIAFVGTDPIVTLPIGEGVEISSLWLATLISLLSAVAIFRTV
jgi:hypothetical protein